MCGGVVHDDYWIDAWFSDKIEDPYLVDEWLNHFLEHLLVGWVGHVCRQCVRIRQGNHERDVENCCPPPFVHSLGRLLH